MTFPQFLADYWWLLFPLAWFVSMGWSSWMKYKRHQANLELLKSYAASGNEPPADLLKALKGDSLGEDSGMGTDENESWSGGSSAFLVILFLGLGAVFAYEGYSDMLGVGDAAYFVAMIMGVMALAFGAGGLFGRRG